MESMQSWAQKKRESQLRLPLASVAKKKLVIISYRSSITLLTLEWSPPCTWTL